MPADPPRGLDDGPRGRILRAAAHLFVTRGYGRTTVRELANAVGILSGSLFHHFRTKDDILESVMLEVIELNTYRLRQTTAMATSPLNLVRALIERELISINGDTSEAMGLLMQEWRSLDAPAQQRVLALRNKYEQIWLDALADAQASLVDVPPFVLRRLISGMTAQTFYWFNPQGPMTIEDLTDHIMMTLVKERTQP